MRDPGGDLVGTGNAEPASLGKELQLPTQPRPLSYPFQGTTDLITLVRDFCVCVSVKF